MCWLSVGWDTYISRAALEKFNCLPNSMNSSKCRVFTEHLLTAAALRIAFNRISHSRDWEILFHR